MTAFEVFWLVLSVGSAYFFVRALVGLLATCVALLGIHYLKDKVSPYHLLNFLFIKAQSGRVLRVNGLVALISGFLVWLFLHLAGIV